MNTQSVLVEITAQLHCLSRLYSREAGYGLYVPFDIKGEEHFLTHADTLLMEGVLPAGYIVCKLETMELVIYSDLTEVVFALVSLDIDELILLRDRLDISIDQFLSFNLHRNRQTELVLDDLGRGERALPVREGLEQFYLKNKDKLDLPIDFLCKHNEIPEEETEEEGFQLTVVEEDESDV